MLLESSGMLGLRLCHCWSGAGVKSRSVRRRRQILSTTGSCGNQRPRIDSREPERRTFHPPSAAFVVTNLSSDTYAGEQSILDGMPGFPLDVSSNHRDAFLQVVYRIVPTFLHDSLKVAIVS